MTHVNSKVHATWGESRNVHWMNGDTRVQGWLMLPKDYDPAKKYPLVVSVHGGPSWAMHYRNGPAGKMGDMTAASLLGWFVLCPNPRGSYGQGEAFTQGNVKDFGNGDYRDIMAGVDAMMKQFPIDPEADRAARAQLWRIHDDVGGDADHAFCGSGCGSWAFGLAELLRAERYRRVDDSVFWRVGV